MTVERPVRWQSDRLFFTGMALVSLLTMLVGFAPTYFLRNTDLPPLTSFYHLHGLVFTAWILLFLAQTALVAAHRTDSIAAWVSRALSSLWRWLLSAFWCQSRRSDAVVVHKSPNRALFSPFPSAT